MKKLAILLSLFLILIGASFANAQLTTISGSLSTPIGVYATGYWGSNGFNISWNITEQADHSWFYEYRLADGQGILYDIDAKAAVSHFTLEVSPNVTADDFRFIAGGTVEFGSFAGIESAMKMDWGSGYYSFYCTRAPVIGSFYAKDGYADIAGGDKVENTAWNNDGSYIYRPDTINNVVPEPSTLILLVTGLFGMGIRRRFRKK